MVFEAADVRNPQRVNALCSFWQTRALFSQVVEPDGYVKMRPLLKF